MSICLRISQRVSQLGRLAVLEKACFDGGIPSPASEQDDAAAGLGEAEAG